MNHPAYNIDINKMKSYIGHTISQLLLMPLISCNTNTHPCVCKHKDKQKLYENTSTEISYNNLKCPSFSDYNKHTHCFLIPESNYLLYMMKLLPKINVFQTYHLQ